MSFDLINLRYTLRRFDFRLAPITAVRDLKPTSLNHSACHATQTQGFIINQRQQPGKVTNPPSAVCQTFTAGRDGEKSLIFVH
jgi:hypothetical protein